LVFGGNSKFAEMCQACNITFIGPDPEVIEMMANKAKARADDASGRCPVVPGVDGIQEDLNQPL
jgi:acetyl-CoA carboxylase biotin carboxylase subunit